MLKKIEIGLTPSDHKKFKAKCIKEKVSMTDPLRRFIKAYIKGYIK